MCRILREGERERERECVCVCVFMTLTQAEMAGAFDVVVDASGSSQGIKLSLALLKPLGRLVLKSTVSLRDPHMPGWSEIANDLVVNEKVRV